MDDIKLYHKVWTILLVLLVLLALMIIPIVPLCQGKGSLLWNCILLLIPTPVFLWGLIVLFRERVLHIPPITITEDRIIVNSVGGIKEYHFADIDRFQHIDFNGFYTSSDVITIHYIRSVETKKMEESKGWDRIYRKMNLALMNAQDSIQVTNLTMKPKQLYHLLNKRLIRI
ncbi:MAG: hypothetical protein IJ557_11555 [Bacteroidaceae bacterium]|nr:hypothetical protein [Bacteroidaceae bacterium]